MIGAARSHVCVLKIDGTVWCWGDNSMGELGNNSTTQSNVPVQVTGLTGVTTIGAGGYNHTCALKADGTVWCWGNNASGELGDGTTTERHSPTQVTGLTGVSVIATTTSFYGTCVLKTDGTVWCWGQNGVGELGDGTVTNRLTPVQVTGLTGVSVVSTSNSTVCALKIDGTVWCWGSNS